AERGGGRPGGDRDHRGGPGAGRRGHLHAPPGGLVRGDDQPAGAARAPDRDAETTVGGLLDGGPAPTRPGRGVPQEPGGGPAEGAGHHGGGGPMSGGERAVVVHPDADTLARATAARFLLALADAQSLRRPVHVAITGGTIGTQVLAEIGRSDLLGVVDF